MPGVRLPTGLAAPMQWGITMGQYYGLIKYTMALYTLPPVLSGFLILHYTIV